MWLYIIYATKQTKKTKKKIYEQSKLEMIKKFYDEFFFSAVTIWTHDDYVLKLKHKIPVQFIRERFVKQ